MTKSELTDTVAKQADVTRDKAAIVVNTVFETMTDALHRNDRIEIRNFGNFVVRKYDAYSGRNPKTGASVKVAAKRMPFFKVGLELKRLVDA